MSPVLRYACFAVLVLFALVVTAVCGELACESFVHACCGRVDRAERLKRVVARVMARVPAQVAVPATAWRGTGEDAAPGSSLRSPTPLALGALRI